MISSTLEYTRRPTLCSPLVTARRRSDPTPCAFALCCLLGLLAPRLSHHRKACAPPRCQPAPKPPQDGPMPPHHPAHRRYHPVTIRPLGSISCLCPCSQHRTTTQAHRFAPFATRRKISPLTKVRARLLLPHHEPRPHKASSAHTLASLQQTPRRPPHDRATHSRRARRH